MSVLLIGQVLIANYTIGFPDYVTEGVKYPVLEYDAAVNTFRIINDKGDECFPLLASFKIVNEEEKIK